MKTLKTDKKKQTKSNANRMDSIRKSKWKLIQGKKTIEKSIKVSLRKCEQNYKQLAILNNKKKRIIKLPNKQMK